MTRIAVVTGAAGGIGAATCEVLEGYGWEVVGLDRLPVERPNSLIVDVSEPDAVEKAFNSLARIDALVNNAALQLFKPLDATTVEDWDRLSDANLRGPFVCLRAARNRLIEARGAVVNIGSVHAQATSSSVAAYAATKGGLVAFTRAAAVELAQHGVRVNAVLPGAIDTVALRQGFDRSNAAERKLIDRTPLHRIGEPREVAEAIAFLVDVERSGFITGSSLVVDGGALARLSTE